LEKLDVLGGRRVAAPDRIGIDRDLFQLQVTGHLHLDHAAAGGGLDHLVFELVLRLHHVSLHLLDLLHHLVEIGLRHSPPYSERSLELSSSRSSASNIALNCCIASSSLNTASPPELSSFSSKLTPIGRPVISRSASETRSRLGRSSTLRLLNAADAG